MTLTIFCDAFQEINIMSAGEVHSSPQSGSPLEQFIILAKNVRGNAAAQLVSQVLEAHGVYVFGEFMNLPNIQVEK